MIWRKKSSFWHLAVVSEPATSGSVYGLSACVSCDVMTAEWLRRFHWEDIDPPPPSRLCGSVASFKQKRKKKDTNPGGFSAVCSQVQLLLVCCCCLFSCFFLSVFVLTGSFWRPSFLRGRASKGGFNPWPPTDQKKKLLHLQKPNLRGPALSRSLPEKSRRS